MNTILWVIGCIALGIFTLAVFGMTIGKKDREDFEYLSAFVNKCKVSGENKRVCLEEFFRLLDRGFIPEEDLDEMRLRIIKKFKF